MLIALEGLDRTGKSSLAAALAHETGARIEHRGAPTQHPLLEYGETLLKHRLGENLVLDRWHWGEAVWPQVFGRPSALTPEMLLFLELLLQGRGGMTAFCVPDFEETVARNERDGELTRGQAVAALRLYRQVARQLDCQHCSVHAPLHTSVPADLIKRSASYERELHGAHDLTGGEWLGRAGTVLLVGERLTAPRIGRLHHVPFVPYGGTSGEYLFRALLHAEMPRVAITNAFLGAKRWLPATQLAVTARPEAVVSLGETAHQLLEREGVRHGAVPHPQYIRRFHHHRLPLYAAALYEAAKRGEDARGWFK